MNLLTLSSKCRRRRHGHHHGPRQQGGAFAIVVASLLLGCSMIVLSTIYAVHGFGKHLNESWTTATALPPLSLESQLASSLKRTRATTTRGGKTTSNHQDDNDGTIQQMDTAINRNEYTSNAPGDAIRHDSSTLEQETSVDGVVLEHATLKAAASGLKNAAESSERRQQVHTSHTESSPLNLAAALHDEKQKHEYANSVSLQSVRLEDDKPVLIQGRGSVESHGEKQPPPSILANSTISDTEAAFGHARVDVGHNASDVGSSEKQQSHNNTAVPGGHNYKVSSSSTFLGASPAVGLLDKGRSESAASNRVSNRTPSSQGQDERNVTSAAAELNTHPASQDKMKSQGNNVSASIRPSSRPDKKLLRGNHVTASTRRPSLDKKVPHSNNSTFTAGNTLISSQAATNTSVDAASTTAASNTLPANVVRVRTEQNTNGSHDVRAPNYFTEQVPLSSLKKRMNILTPFTGCSIAAFQYNLGKHSHPELNDCVVHCGRQFSISRGVRNDDAQTLVKANDTIFVQLNKLWHFVNFTMDQIHVDFVILSGNEQKAPPLDKHVWEAIVNNPRVLHVFMQNVDIYAHDLNHPKVSPWPYGANPKKLDEIAAELRRDPPKNNNKIYLSGFSRATNKKRFDIPRGERVPVAQYLRNMRASHYVISPDGDRPECYRHYEAIGMGVMPITQLDMKTHMHLYGNAVFKNTDNWNLTIIEQNLPRHPRVNQRLIFEEYWMEYVERIVGRPLRWWDPSRDVHSSLKDIQHLVSHNIQLPKDELCVPGKTTKYGDRVDAKSLVARD